MISSVKVIKDGQLRLITMKVFFSLEALWKTKIDPKDSLSAAVSSKLLKKKTGQ